MPLSAPVKRPSLIVNKVKNAILQGLGYIRPDIVLMIFLLVGVVLAFLKYTATGFYSVFGIFIIGYFAERIIKSFRKKNL